MAFEWSCSVPLCQNLFPSPLCVCVCVCVCFSKKKKEGNCLILLKKVYTLLKRVCYVQYNSFHPPLKVTMAFEWSCDVSLCQNPFLSPLCVCVFISPKKEKEKKKDNCPTLLKRVCYVQYNLPHPSLKVTMTFEWSCDVSLCQNLFPSSLYGFVS